MDDKIIFFRLVPQSKCEFSARLALAFEEQVEEIEEKQVCCPLGDVITCDPNGFRCLIILKNI